MIRWIRTMIECPWEFIHSSDVYGRGCDGPAFYLTEKPGYGTPGRSAVIRHLDGTRYAPGSPMVCESCGCEIGILASSLVRRRSLLRRPWLAVRRLSG